MVDTDKTHFRKAFDSPYLSSADIVEPTALTIRCVRLESDRTEKSRDHFNTAYFVEREIRKGEALKPMILNATNSKMLRQLTGSPFIDDWNDVPVTVWVDPNVRFGKETVEGLRLRSRRVEKKTLTPGMGKAWSHAKEAYRRDGNLDAVLARADISPEHQQQLKRECEAPPATADRPGETTGA